MVIILLFCRKLEYTRETLVAFKKDMAEKAAAAKKGGGQEAGGFGGFGGFGGGAGAPADKKVGTFTKSVKFFYM